MQLGGINPANLASQKLHLKVKKNYLERWVELNQKHLELKESQLAQKDIADAEHNSLKRFISDLRAEMKRDKRELETIAENERQIAEFETQELANGQKLDLNG